MKRLFYSAGIIITLGLLGSCAQHDSQSPDTSGAAPYDQPGVGVDTTNAGTTNAAGRPNASNDGTNNNGNLSTADSSLNRQ